MNEAHRRVWAASVAKLVYPVDPARATAKIVEYLPLLSDLPDEAFNPHSMEAVALYERRMALPSFDEIAKPLRTWWRDNRPRTWGAPSMLPPPVDEPREHTEEEKAAQAAAMAQFLADRSEAAKGRPEDVKPAYLPVETLRAIRDADPLVQQARKFREMAP
jgi:hypothetical protein